MSVGLYRYNGDIYDRKSELTLSENISTQEFYDEHWERAIHELGISIIRDGSGLPSISFWMLWLNWNV